MKVRTDRIRVCAVLIACALLVSVAPARAAYEGDQYIKVSTSVSGVEIIEAGESCEVLVSLTGDEFSLDPELVDPDHVRSKSIVLVLDISGSMSQRIDGVKTRLDVLKESTIEFVQGMAGTNTSIAVVAYHTHANELTPLLTMTEPSNVSYLTNFISNLRYLNMTNIGDGMRRAYWRLMGADPDSAKYAIVMTDGEPNYYTTLISSRTGPFKMDDGNAQYTFSDVARSVQYASAFGALLVEEQVKSYFIGLTTTHSANFQQIAVSAGAEEVQEGVNYYRVVTAEEVDYVFNDILAASISSFLPVTVAVEQVLPHGIVPVSVPQGFATSLLADGRYMVSGTVPNMGLQKNEQTEIYSITPWQGVIGVMCESTGVKDFPNAMVAYTDPFGNDKVASVVSALSLTVVDTTAPTIPLAPEVVTNDGDRVLIGWTTSYDFVGVEGYEVLRDGLPVWSGPNTSFEDGNITQGVSYSYSVRAFDASGNVSTESESVLVSVPDTTAPSVPTNLAVTAKTSTSIALLWDESSDNVAVTGYTVYRDGLPLASIGGTTYTDDGLATGVEYIYTVAAFDAAGNESVHSVPLAVSTNSAPVADAGEDIVVEATSSSGAVVLLDAAKSYDPDGDALTFLWTGVFGASTQARFEVEMPLGTHTIVLSVSDGLLDATDSVLVCVQDTTPPELTVPGDVLVEATGVDTEAELGTAEAVDLFAVTLQNDAPSAFGLGTTTVTWTATDANGNWVAKTQLVTVQDTTPPNLTVPQDVTLEATALQMAVDIGEATASDIFAVTITHDAPVVFELGTTSVTWVATDANGNFSSAVQLVTITDTTPPELIPPADVEVEATQVMTPVDIGFADASDIFLADVHCDAPAAYPLGQTVVTWTAVDTSGNSTSRTQAVRVIDTTPPVLSVPADLSCEATALLTGVNLGQPIAVDIFDVIITNDAPLAGFELGTTTVTWVAQDTSGNSCSGTQLVTIVDTTPPSLTVPSDPMAEANAVMSVVYIGEPIVHDIFGASVTNDAPDYYPLGTTYVTWTAVDPNGNSSSAVQPVTVLDTTPPILNLPPDILIEATAVRSIMDIGEASASDIFDVTLSNDAPDDFGIGVTLVTWKAEDSNGNVTLGTQRVEVRDTTAPVLNVPQDVVAVATGEYTYVGIGQATATDIFPVTVQNDAPVVFGVGTTTVTWTATDANGNVSVGVQFVTVEMLNATVDLDPNVLNLQSKGSEVSITCYVELPSGYDVSLVDVNTVVLVIGDIEIAAQKNPTARGDNDRDGIPDRMFKFDRSQVTAAIETVGDGTCVVTVKGVLSNGYLFTGQDSIRVIAPPAPKKPR